MFSICRALIDRFKAFFMMHAVLELEADLIILGAERKAELLSRADQFEKAGRKIVAQELRRRAETLSSDELLGSVQVSIAHLQTGQAPLTNPPLPPVSEATAGQASTSRRAKKKP